MFRLFSMLIPGICGSLMMLISLECSLIHDFVISFLLDQIHASRIVMHLSSSICNPFVAYILECSVCLDPYLCVCPFLWLYSNRWFLDNLLA